MLKISREYIAKKLKQLRERAGLTVYQVGEIVGRSGKTVSAWENNHGQPDAEMLIKLCDVYNVEDILSEFRVGEKKTSYFNITDFEKILIIEYRNHPEMHNAINKMLDINEDTNIGKITVANINQSHDHYAVIAAKGQGPRKHSVTDEQNRRALEILREMENETDNNY